MATPSAPAEMATVAMVATRARSGRLTSEAMPRSRTAPPIMMTGGMMASQRMDGTGMVPEEACEVACEAASSGAITSCPPRP